MKAIRQINWVAVVNRLKEEFLVNPEYLQEIINDCTEQIDLSEVKDE